MNKHLILSLTIASAFAFDAGAMVTTTTTGNDVYGHTFMSIRPEFESAFPEKTSQFRDRAMARCDGFGGAFQFVAFGGRSTNAKGLMRYFSPKGETELVVNSDNANLLRDINPTFFGIQISPIDPLSPSSFASTLQFRPRRSVGGLGITYRQYVGRGCDVADRKWFFELSAPILHVRNKMNITETAPVLTNATLDAGSNSSLTEAFTGLRPVLGTGTFTGGVAADPVRMQFGLINDITNDATVVLPADFRSPRKAMSATGSDIELKFGYDYYSSECCHFDGYVGLHIPASRKPNARYVFEAIPGFNQHFGFMVGGSSGTEIWRDCDRSLTWEVETNARYFVQNTQTRSFDLKNRPWSRYMWITDLATPATPLVTPAINVLSRSMKVSPRFSFDLNAALVFGHDCGFNAELGYNFFARQAEKVQLKEEFPVDRYFVTALNVNNTVNIVQTNLLSNIGNVADDSNLETNIANTAIRARDLNLLSAAAPAVLTNLVYASVGYNWDNRCHPMFVKLGGSYEFSSNNTGLDRWLVWGGFGVSI